MSTSSKWPPAKTNRLIELADEGFTRREISQKMNISILAVTTKLHLLGIPVELGTTWYARQKIKLPKPWFPQFEDITPSEARQISADAPRSAKIKAPDRTYSIYGSSLADMVA